MWGMSTADDNRPDTGQAKIPIGPDRPGAPQPSRPAAGPSPGSGLEPPAPGTTAPPVAGPPPEKPGRQKEAAREIGGPAGPEPTRYGDWERKGRVSDF